MGRIARRLDFVGVIALCVALTILPLLTAMDAQLLICERSGSVRCDTMLEGSLASSAMLEMGNSVDQD